MGVVGTIGYLLIGCGPAGVIFATRIARRPFLVVLTFTSCASWILTATVLAVPLAFFLPFGSERGYVLPFVVCVVCHELCRRVVWRTLTRWMASRVDAIASHFGYRKVSAGDSMNMHLAWGLGQGMARGLFFFAANTVVSVGPGTIYTKTCPAVPYFLTSAVMSLAFVSIHTSAMLLEFSQDLERSNSFVAFLEGAAPALAGTLTLGNLANDGCLVVMPMLVVFATGMVWHTGARLRQ